MLQYVLSPLGVHSGVLLHQSATHGEELNPGNGKTPHWSEIASCTKVSILAPHFDVTIAT